MVDASGRGRARCMTWDASARRTTKFIWIARPNRADPDVIILVPYSFYSSIQFSLIQRTVVPVAPRATIQSR
jgi:hypothetical protein